MSPDLSFEKVVILDPMTRLRSYAVVTIERSKLLRMCASPTKNILRHCHCMLFLIWFLDCSLPDSSCRLFLKEHNLRIDDYLIASV